MNESATRAKLIQIISEHHYSLPGKKLGVSELSDRVGITRQAFNRYYGDLKDYAWGRKPLSDLLTGSAPNATELLAQSHTRLLELNEQVETQQAQFAKEKDKLRNGLITSLMNDDIVRFSANEIRQSMQQQLLHNEQLLRQVNELKLAAIQSDQEKAAEIPAAQRLIAHKIALEANLLSAFAAIHKNEDIDNYELLKEKAIDEVLGKINGIARTTATTLIVFVERYISSFQKFVDNFYLPNSGQIIIVRLPIASSLELKSWMAKVIKPTPIKVYFPMCDAPAIVKAQRAFHFRSTPDFELEMADKFSTINMSPLMDELCIFRVNQGD